MSSEIADSMRQGINGAAIAGTPLAMVSIVPLFAESTPEATHPLREMAIAGVDNFMDHAGNFVNGYLATYLVLQAGVLAAKKVGDKLGEENEKRVIIGVSAAAASVSVGVNIAYEAGVHIPPYSQKPESAPFDAADAAFGGINGILTAIGFCIAALRARSKAREREHLSRSLYDAFDTY